MQNTKTGVLKQSIVMAEITLLDKSDSVGDIFENEEEIVFEKGSVVVVLRELYLERYDGLAHVILDKNGEALTVHPSFLEIIE